MQSVKKVSNVLTRYRLDLEENHSETLAGQIGNIIRSPWQNLRRLRVIRFGAEASLT